MPRRKKTEEEVYHVEVITKARVTDDGEWEYFVKWGGYGSDADSWEPAENVQQCDRLLESFWKHIGTDDDDYPVGYEIAAGPDWIDKEKKYFKRTYFKSLKRKSDKTAKKNTQKQKSKPSTSYVSDSTVDDDTESSEDVPTTTTTSTRILNRKAHVVDTESESECSDHLPKQIKAPSHAKASTPPPEEISRVNLNCIPPHRVHAEKSPAQSKSQGLPSAAGGSISIVPPKVTAVRTHQDQRANPLVKSMSLPSESVGAGSSLSTKQRVAAGMPPPPAGPKLLPPMSKKSLPQLSFKKHRPVISPVSQVKDAIASTTSVATPTSSVVQSAVAVHDAAVVVSPKPMDVDQPSDLWGFTPDDAAPPEGSFDNPIVPIPPKSQREIDAEKFLDTIHVPELSDLLEMSVIPDQPEQPITDLTKSSAMSKIPKKWKWSGDLFISTSETNTELLCVVTIADPSGRSNISHINLLLSSLDSLRISKLYPIMDLSSLLRACGEPQYFGILESSDASEEVIIHGLGHYLTTEGLAAVIPLLLDGTEAAVLVIFPGTQLKLTRALQVPEHLPSGNTLVVLLPFLVSTATSTTIAGKRSTQTVVQSSISTQDVSVPSEISQEAALYQAVTFLCFPKALLDFFNGPTRKYCIWPLSNQSVPELDTLMLQYILKSIKAVSARPEDDLRVVFISNQYLETVHTMPTLVTKLANSPEIQFWTYGYSTNTSPQRWKVQEIYPLGGIVTFTASAIAADLMGCYHLMTQIIEHPLWDCCVIPEVLAVSHLLCSDRSSDSTGRSYLDSILDLINLGSISAMRMLPNGHSNQQKWISEVFNHSSAGEHELLKAYLQVLKDNPTTLNMTDEQLIAFTNDEITKDLSNAQIQPAFMENYRRFVVIRAPPEEVIPFDKNGLEWLTLSQFSFKDDYFQS